MPNSLLENWYADVQHFTHMGSKVAYVDNGRTELPVMLLLHGFPNSSWEWRKLWQALDKNYRLVALDFLGNGQSDKPPEHDYSVMDQADQVCKLLTVLSVKKVHLVGHSSGISVAQELLALRERDADPDIAEILSIVFMNGSVVPANAPTIMEQRLAASQGADVAQFMNASFIHNVLNTLAGASNEVRQGEAEVVWEQLSSNGGTATMVKLLHYIEERQQQFERWEQTMLLSMTPMCAVIGIEDPVWGPAQIAKIEEALPAIRTVALDAVGHYPFLHAAKQTAQAIINFHSDSL